jgi:hypothetical protein
MPVPTYLVYLSFSSSGFIDVTSYATSVSVDRGSPRILDDTQVGQATVSFINNDRTFDPFNTSSILYNYIGGYTLVQPNAKVVIYSGGVVIFTGWVQNWDFTNDEKGLDARASLMATDGLGVLAKANFNPTLITAANTAGQLPTPRISSATATWGGTAVSISLAGSAGKTPLIGDTFDQGTTVLAYLQNVARTEPGYFWGTKDGNAKWTDRSLSGRLWNPSASPSYNYHTTAGFYNGTATDMSNWTNVITYTGQINGTVTTNASFPGEYVLQAVSNGYDFGFEYTETDATKYKPNTAYSMSFWTNATDPTASLYLYQRAIGTALKASNSTVSSFTGGWNQVKVENVTTSLSMNTIDIIITASSVFQIKDLIISPTTTASTIYFDGERYQETSSTFLSDQQRQYTGWTGVERNSTSVYATTTNAGTTSTPTMESFADNFGTAVVATALPISDLQVQYASDQFYNQVNVVRASGGTATTGSTASQALYGIRTFGQTDNLGISPAKSTAMVSEIYGQFGSPDYVVTSLDLQLEAMAGTAQARVQAIDLYDPARVVFRPSSTGSNIDKKYTIISIKQDFTPETHKVSLGLAPLGAGMLLNSTYLGILDTQKVV